MGLEAPGWVLLYIAAFGVSDTLVALVAPNSPYLFFYYFILGCLGYRMIRQHSNPVKVSPGNNFDNGCVRCEDGDNFVGESVP